jgi:guanine nucleotide-binding protein alpha-1 subunit
VHRGAGHPHSHYFQLYMSILVPRLRSPAMSKKRGLSPWPPPPPERETLEERHTRRKMEAEAKCKSDSIDLQLKLEREKRAKQPSGPKILLLGEIRCIIFSFLNMNSPIPIIGQAESGKSTVLKNFQLHFTPKAFELEVGTFSYAFGNSL